MIWRSSSNTRNCVGEHLALAPVFPLVETKSASNAVVIAGGRRTESVLVPLSEGRGVVPCARARSATALRRRCETHHASG